VNDGATYTDLPR